MRFPALQAISLIVLAGCSRPAPSGEWSISGVTAASDMRIVSLGCHSDEVLTAIYPGKTDVFCGAGIACCRETVNERCTWRNGPVAISTPVGATVTWVSVRRAGEAPPNEARHPLGAGTTLVCADGADGCVNRRSRFDIEIAACERATTRAASTSSATPDAGAAGAGSTSPSATASNTGPSRGSQHSLPTTPPKGGTTSGAAPHPLPTTSEQH